MALTAGTRLGPYEVIAPIGAGGMGEVYSAKDTRLDRTVALKILPLHLADTPEVRQRFEREARAVSSLNHPNICALYDIGQQDGTDFLVMEYLEGQTLAKRIEQGPMPTPELLRVAVQICEALERAHRQGVIHRDLKPGNVMLTKAGAKLLDFGLAKGAAPAVTDMSSSPTVTQPLPGSSRGNQLTVQGTIVGTLQYMPPEQLEGGEADARSDIFSFGATLYEMATGQKAFPAKSQASLIAEILKAQPRPISELQPLVPPALERIVTTCLAKDPDDRWQSAGDLKRELVWISSAGSLAGVPAPVIAQRKTRERTWKILLAAVGLVAAAGIAGSLFFARKASQPTPVIHAEMNPPEGYEFGSIGKDNQFAISPDGSAIAFVAEGQRKQLLFVRLLSSGTTQPLQGTDGASYPFWSGDGRNLAFFADSKLKRVPATGGVVQVLCDAPAGRGGTWNQSGVIVFTPGLKEPLYKIPDSGGTPAAVTAVKQSAALQSHRWPSFLPDGKHFLFTTDDGVGVGSLDSTDIHVFLPAKSNAVYSSGYILYVTDGNLVAQPFDPDHQAVRGVPVPMAGQVEFSIGKSLGNFSVSQTGGLVYRPDYSPKYQMTWLDRNGGEAGKLGETDYYSGASISPDGRRILVTRAQPGVKRDLWLIDSQRGSPSRATFDPEGAIFGVWSPDGASVTVSLANGFEIRKILLQGNVAEQLVAPDQISKYPTDWTADGQTIILTVQNPKTGQDVETLAAAGEHKLAPMIQTPAFENAGNLSPSGKLLTYSSNESGRPELYVTEFPGPGMKWQASDQGLTSGIPVHFSAWSHDGKTLYYIDAGGSVIAVPVESQSPFKAGVPKKVYSASTGPVSEITAAPDGRLLVLVPAGNQTITPAALVINWPAELKGKQ
jgi:serine/threonine protein kinase/Tol biopolymer transport system component